MVSSICVRLAHVYCPLVFVFVFCAISVIGHLAVVSWRKYEKTELQIVPSIMVSYVSALHAFCTLVVESNV
jgi:hypothetical protein